MSLGRATGKWIHSRDARQPRPQSTGDLTIDKLTIRLIVISGPKDMPVGAERSFELLDNGDHCALTLASWESACPRCIDAASYASRFSTSVRPTSACLRRFRRGSRMRVSLATHG